MRVRESTATARAAGVLEAERQSPKVAGYREPYRSWSPLCRLRGFRAGLRRRARQGTALSRGWLKTGLAKSCFKMHAVRKIEYWLRLF